MIKYQSIAPKDILTRKDSDSMPAFLTDEGPVDWLNFLKKVNGWKLAFQSNQVKRAALFFPRIDEATAALFGAWCAKTIAILPAYNGAETVSELRERGVTYFAGEFPGILPEERISCVATEQPCRDTFEEHAPLLELFTSGSTGQPTLVIKRLEQIFSEVSDMMITQHGVKDKISDHCVVLSTVSAQHIYGLLFYQVWPLTAGRPVYAERVQYPETLVKLLERYGDCILITSPAHLNRLPEDPALIDCQSRIKVIYSSGGPVSNEGLMLSKKILGQTPYEIFGSTESGGIAWRQRPINTDASIGKTLWHLMPGVQAKTDNEGVLHIKSKRLYSSDWEKTSDIVSLNTQEHTFEHLKRADRIVKIEGKRVSLTAIENFLAGNPLIHSVKVFRLNDQRESLSVVAIPSDLGIDCLKNQGKNQLVRQLKASLLDLVERVCVPRYWRFVSEFPVNFMGKVATSLLQALFDPSRPQFVVEHKTETTLSAIVTIASNSPFFDGHFPEFKLLPGVTQCQWAIEIANHAFGNQADPMQFSGIKQLKFVQPIRPNSTVHLTLTLDSKKKECSFSYMSQKAVLHAKGIIQYNPTHS